MCACFESDQVIITSTPNQSMLNRRNIRTHVHVIFANIDGPCECFDYESQNLLEMNGGLESSLTSNRMARKHIFGAVKFSWLMWMFPISWSQIAWIFSVVEFAAEYLVWNEFRSIEDNVIILIELNILNTSDKEMMRLYSWIFSVNSLEVLCYFVEFDHKWWTIHFKGTN